MGTISEFFETEEKEMVSEAEKLHKILTHLRYEGKVSRGKNVMAARKALEVLGQVVRRHRNLQEKVIFPFLSAHIPRHEAVIHFLHSDHQDIQRSKHQLEASLRLLSKKVHERVEDGKTQETGVYLICLLRHHIDLESKSIHRAIRNELRRDERMEVKEKINKWLVRHDNGIRKNQGKRGRVESA